MITISLLYNPYSDTISWHILYYAAYTGQGQLKWRSRKSVEHLKKATKSEFVIICYNATPTIYTTLTLYTPL
jgi:hypothetical protein